MLLFQEPHRQERIEIGEGSDVIISLSLLHGQKVQNGHPRGINVTPRLPRPSMHVNDRHA